MLKNYKNFKEEIVIDFQGISGYQFSQDCITDGIISKMLIQQKICLLYTSDAADD